MNPDSRQYNIFLSISLISFLLQLMVLSLFTAPLGVWKRKRGTAVSVAKQVVLVLDVETHWLKISAASQLAGRLRAWVDADRTISFLDVTWWE